MSEMSEPDSGPQDVVKRRLKYALIASLALNLLILGAVAGTMYGFRKHHASFGGERGQDFGLMGLTRTLPEERRKEIRKQLRDDRVTFRPLVEETRKSRLEAADKLAAETFDRAALESAIAAVAEKERALRQAAVTSFLGHAEKLTVDERRQLADWWRKKSQPFKRKGKDADKTADEADDPPAK